MSRALLDLPVLRWARLFSHGTVRVDGALREPIRLSDRTVDAGAVCLEIVFRGGQEPIVSACRLTAGSCHERPLGDVDEASVVLAGLGDVAVEARTEADRVAALHLAGEVRLLLEPTVVVTVSAAATGPASSLRLLRPIVVGFSGDGARVQYGSLQMISRWADLRLHRAVLHPDGRVRLQGGGAKGLDFTARAGLKTASAAVTKLVRRGERFRSLRGFLQVEEP